MSLVSLGFLEDGSKLIKLGFTQAAPIAIAGNLITQGLGTAVARFLRLGLYQSAGPSEPTGGGVPSWFNRRRGRR